MDLIFDIGSFATPYFSLTKVKIFINFFRDAKPHGKIRKLGELIPDFGSISSAACNAPGTKVAITCLKVG